MPAVAPVAGAPPVTTTIVKQGCLDADVVNAINQNTLNAGFPNDGFIAGSYVATAEPFGNFTTGGTAKTVLAASSAAGTYRVSIFGVVTTTFTGATAIQLNSGWTDDQGAHSSTHAFGALTAGTVLTAVDVIRSTGAAAITVTEVGTVSNATAGAMALSVVLERLL